MQSIQEVTKRAFPFAEAGEKECSSCGTVYKLYETPRGILGSCKTCADKALISSLNLPKVEDLANEKLAGFIKNFEKVTSDIESATVRSYHASHPTQLKAKQLVIEYLKNFDGTKSIVISGTPGLGKSHLAYSAVKAVRGKKLNSFFTKTTDLLALIKQSYSGSTISEEQIFNMIGKLDLLVLDDMGSEYVKSNGDGTETWASEILYKIFDMRIEKATICTTNYSERELKEKYGKNGERFISRMLYRSTGIRLEGEDYRRRESF